MGRLFQELNLKSAFLFAAALEDAETCRLVLELVLGQTIPSVTVHAEHSLLYNSDFRSLRLDVYAGDEMKVEYNVEMQNENEGNLAKRSRFHQAEMDVTALKPGEDFHELRPSYVVFICTFDPFGGGLYRYTFENCCLENGILLEDGAKKIFLNTKGTNQTEVPEELVEFLRYVEESTDEVASSAEDERITRLHKRIRKLKENRSWEARYMRFEELLQQAEKAGLEKGEKAGLEKGEKAGLAKGEKQKLIKLVAGKAARGQSAEEIAEDLLENADVIRPIFDYIKSHPGCDEDAVCEALKA